MTSLSPRFLAGLLQPVHHGANGIDEGADLVARGYLVDGGKIALADLRHGGAKPHDRLRDAIGDHVPLASIASIRERMPLPINQVA